MKASYSRFSSISLPAAMLMGLCLTSLPGFSQTIVRVPDDGWHLWLDSTAQWENDSIWLPGEMSLRDMPVNAPTGGWEALDKNPGLIVTLPSTVEQHFWGIRGFRPYREEEYYFQGQDSTLENGNYLGVSWWWRDVNVPASFKEKKVLLSIRGARFRAEVYVNRQLVGYNIITETSFECDVSGAVRPGQKNRIAIRITNPGGRLDWVDTQLMPWGKTGKRFHRSHGFGGLDRGMELTAHDPVYVDDLWVLNKPDRVSITAHAALRNTTSSKLNAALRMEILDPDERNKVCSVSDQRVQVSPNSGITLPVELAHRSASLWSDKHPKLYRLRATLTIPGRRWQDTRTVTFGFRWFEADGVGNNAMLRFNGDRIRLVSAISWGFWGINGLWPTPELAEREVHAAKTLGMNCIQFHRNVGKTEVLDLQDRLGLFRYMEPGGGQTSFGEKFSLYAPSPRGRVDDSGGKGDPETFAEKYMEEKIVRMVHDHRSHPSLLLYCIQNEIHPDLRNPRVFHVLRRIHQEDPSRIVVLKSGFPSGSPSVNQAWMNPYSDVAHYDTGDGYSGWWDDHTVGGPGVWRDEMYRGPDDFTHRSTNAKEIVMWGEMLGAAVPDNHALMVRQLVAGGGKSYDLKDHQEILNAYDRFLDKWGFRGAFPTADRLFVSIGNKSYDFWGRVIETARLAEANDYFVMSGWESTAIENHSGLVDNLRDFKGDPSLISTRLVPLRPVIKLPSLVFAKGSSTRADLFLINETNKPHGGQMRLWFQDPSGARSELGTFPIPPFQPDRFVYGVTMGLQLPTLSTEGEYTIHAGLSNDEHAFSEEKIFVADPVGQGPLPKTIGIVTTNPALVKPFDLFSGVRVEPYQPENGYDLVVMADRVVRPYETGTEPKTEIQGTDDDELYRTIGYGDATTLEYIFPGLPKGTATVTLKFAELFQDAENMRVFDVALNGETVLKDFDVFKAAGGKNIAYDRTFRVPLPDGYLHITFPRVPKPSARICAIKIEAGDTVVAINCGGKEYVDRNGLVWRPYDPAPRVDKQLLEKVKAGLPLLVLTEGDVATARYAEELGKSGAYEYKGFVGEARASWMGSWYFIRDNPVYQGMPVNCAMGSYYQVPVTNSGGVLLDGKNVEVFVGYSRDHDRSIAGASFSSRLGRGKVLFHSLPGVVTGLNGPSAGMHPVLLKRLLANSLRFLTK